MRKTLLFVVAAAVLGACACLVQADDSNPPAVEEEFSLDKMIEELNESESRNEKSGSDFLNEALALKMTGSTLKDIENVLELAQKAIGKGLTPEDEKMARELIRSTLLQRASVTAEILRSGRAESEREVAIIAKIGMMDLEQLKKTFGPNESEKDFEGADLYWYVKTTLMAYSGQDEKEIFEALKTAKKLNQEDDQRMAQLLYIEASLKSSEPEEQLKLLKQAYKKDSESEDIERMYIIALARNDKIAEAAKLILPLMKDSEECDPIYALILSDYYQEKEQPDKAMEWLNRIPKPAADSISVIRAKFFCAIDLEDKQQILDLSLKLLNEDPQNLEIRKFRIRLMLNDKRLDSALEEVRLALFFEENSKELQMLKTLILCRKDNANFDDAKKAIEELLKDKDADIEALTIAITVAQTTKDMDLMLRVTQKILELDEKNESALSELPSIYIVLKQYDKAVEAFEKSLKEYPENPSALNNYSWFLSTTDQDAWRNGKKALELGLKAAEMTKYEKAYILSTLAAAYAETGDFENALKFIQKALEINKDETITESMKNEMESYKQNKPIRESADEWFK